MLGWAVVAEYQANELTDNSDDERKLEHAERAKLRMANGHGQLQFPARKDSLATPQKVLQLRVAIYLLL